MGTTEFQMAFCSPALPLQSKIQLLIKSEVQSLLADLLLCWFLEAGEVNERREAHQTLTAGDSDAEPQAVGEEGAVGVAPVWEVNNTQQLGEQDHVDQVGAERPAGEHGYLHLLIGERGREGLTISRI